MKLEMVIKPIVMLVIPASTLAPTSTALAQAAATNEKAQAAELAKELLDPVASPKQRLQRPPTQAGNERTHHHEN